MSKPRESVQPVGSNAIVSRSPSGRGHHQTPPQSAVGSALLTEFGWAEVARSLQLSERQLQIARGVFDNKVEEAMAGEIGISTHTVHTHLSRLFGKLGVTTRIGLVLRVWNELLLITLSPDGALPSLCRRRAAGRCPVGEGTKGNARRAGTRGQQTSGG